MKRKLYFTPIIIALISIWTSCRKDFEYKESTGTLEFSKDTIFLDTVFSSIGSSTYSLKVYNRSQEDIQIPIVRLTNRQASNYRLNVDGLTGKEFNNIPILAKDSIFVFIETTVNTSSNDPTEFLYTDVIEFHSKNNTQNIELVTLVKDAVFLYPKTLVDGTKETLILGLTENDQEVHIEGFPLSDSQLHLTNEKAYVIYGYAAVSENKTLIVDAGARVHFHENSGIIVGNNASLKVNGSLSTDLELMENEVIFEGDRLEPSFEYIPGQWGTIWLASGSVANEIDHLTIKNATVGLLVDGVSASETPILSIKNSQIHNSSNFNLWGRSTLIKGENMVIGNAGVSSLYCNLGGAYSFLHSTIANYWANGPRKGSTLLIDNYIELETGEIISNDLIQASFQNCIIDGNGSAEILLKKNDDASFNFLIENSLLKFNDSFNQFTENPLYDFENSEAYKNLFLNLSTSFVLPQKNNFNITEAIGKANTALSITSPIDILGNNRTNAPDIGAYQFIPNN